MTRIADITFESNSLTGTNGASSTTGAGIAVTSTGPIKGTYSADVNVSANTGFVTQTYTATDTIYVSVYIKYTTFPGATANIIEVRDATGSIVRIRVTSGGSVQLFDAAGQIGSGVTISTGTIYRVGLRYTKGTGANAIAQMFVATGDAAFSGTPDAQKTNGTETTQSDRIRCGGTVSSTQRFLIDDMRVDDSSMPGPSVAFADTTFTAAASKYAQIDNGFTAAASLQGTISTAFTASASLQKTIDTTFTASASLYAIVETSFTARASIAANGSVDNEFTVCAAIAMVVDTDFTARVGVRGLIDIPFDIVAALATVIDTEFTASASISNSFDNEFTAAASIQATIDSNFTATASLSDEVDTAFTASASFSKSITTEFSAAASLSADGRITFTARASIARQNVDTSFSASVSISVLVAGPRVIFGLEDDVSVSYELWITDSVGRPTANITNRQFLSLDYSRVVNAYTELTLVLPGSFDRRKIYPDGIIQVYRRVGRSPLLLDTETVWFIHKIQRTQDESGMKTITITARSANVIMNQRIVAYAESETLGYTTKSDQADDLIIAIVKENYGSLAVNTSRRTSLTIPDAIAAGPLVYKQFALRYLDEVFKEICETSYTLGTPLYWDVIASSPPLGLALRIYYGQRGDDKRWSSKSPLIVGPAQKSITSWSVVEDYTTEVNAAYIGGPGVDQDTIIIPVEDATRATRGPYSRRELYEDYRDTSSVTALTHEGQAVLRRGTPSVVYQGRLASIPGALYGKDWKWGDRITAQDDEHNNYDCRVNGIHVSVQNNGEETIDASLRSDE